MKFNKKGFVFLSSIIPVLIFMFSSVSVFAAGTETWTTKASMSTARRFHQVAVLDGKIYAIGGSYNGSLNSVEEYDPTTDTWITKASMITARQQFQVAVVGGKIYAIGGWSDINGSLNSVEEYDPTTNKWISKAPMTTAGWDHQVAVVGGKIYVIDGFNDIIGSLNSVEEYDPATNTWTSKASMTTGRGHQVAVLDGKIYAIGGSYNGSLNSVEEYDPTTDTWITKASMITERQQFQIAVVGGKIYAIGGWDGVYHNSVEEYDPATNTWITKAPMPTARDYHEVAIVGGKIYAIGGYNETNGSLNSVEEYNPATNTWTIKAPMTDERYYHQVAVVGDNIYTIGGYSGTSYLYSVEEYDTGNIDETPPVITIGSYLTTPTNQDITVTATTNEGTLNEAFHIFTENGSFDFVATDSAGNVTKKTVTINNIDKTANTTGIKEIEGSFILKTDGTLWATGENINGQLGDGTQTSFNTWKQVLTNVDKVSSGCFNTFALKKDGTLWMAGADYYGSYIEDSAWRQVLSGVSQMSCGWNHSLALKTDGTLWAAGTNWQGELGDGTNKNSDTWKQVLTGVSQVYGGDWFSVALKKDGTVWATGDNEYGQLGDGTTTDSNSWKQVLTNVTQINTSRTHVFAIKNDDTLWATGMNSSGQLGDGTITNKTSWTQVMTGVYKVSAGNGFSLAIKTDGTLWATGDNKYGQLGDGTSKNSSTWKQVLTDVSKIRAGNGRSSLALKTDGTVWAAGSNEWGEFGNGTNTDSISWIKVFPSNTISLTTSNATTTTVDVTVTDGNPETTQYQIVSGNQYVTAAGTMTTTPTWITLTGKKITVTGLVPNTAYSFQAKARDSANIETAWSQPVIVTTLPEALGTIKINFQPVGSEIPQGYLPDYGEVYGVRNGYSYGWNVGYAGATRDRNINADQKLDTLIMLYKTGKWEIAVDNGLYDVTVCVGDAGFSSTPTVNVEGVNYWGGINLGVNQYLQVTKTVMVTDGRLTIDNGGTADQITKLNYVEIAKHSIQLQKPINLQASAAQDTVTLTWEKSYEMDLYEVEADGSIYAVTGVAFTHTFLEGGTTHSYRVRTVNGAEKSEWSDMLTISTQPEAPGTIKINFQPAGSEIPQGYIPDYGEVYGVRNGYNYGWNVGYAGATRDRNINADQKLDTLIMLYKTGKWEMEVEDGSYDVTVCVGDAGFSSTPTVNVEGVNYWAGINLGVNQYLQATKTVMVTDGRLTIDNGGTADQITKINYVKIVKNSVMFPAPTTVAEGSVEISGDVVDNTADNK